jgi:hypothetical protein
MGLDRVLAYNKAGRIWGHGFTPKVIWAIVKANAKRERYLECKQRFRDAVNDHIGLEPRASS